MASVIVGFVSVGLCRFVLTLCFCFFLWRAGACGFAGGGGEGERRSTPETLISPSATSSLELLFILASALCSVYYRFHCLEWESNSLMDCLFNFSLSGSFIDGTDCLWVVRASVFACLI